MRTVNFLVCLVLLASVLSCKKENASEKTSFDFEKMAGIWVPYQAVAADGTIDNGPFTALSLFAVYAESVQINKDQSFVPVTWMDANNFVLKDQDKGTITYSCGARKLFFKNTSELEFTLIKDEGELWLKGPGLGILYKFLKK